MTAAETKIPLSSGDALILVDVENDVLPRGALAISGGGEIIPLLNDYTDTFDRLGLPIFATRDGHPPDHCSFRAQGDPWPPHCVAHRSGASFPAGRHFPVLVRVISTADSPDTDACSGFDGTDLDALLRGLGTTRLLIGGLATDYCVLIEARYPCGQRSGAQRRACARRNARARRHRHYAPSLAG